MKGVNNVFRKEVVFLIISKVLNFSVEIISLKDLCVVFFGDLDIGRIVEKVYGNIVIMKRELE